MTETGFKLYLLQEQNGKKRVRGSKTVSLHLQNLQRLKHHAPSLSPSDVSEYLLGLYEQGRKGTYLNDYIDTLRIYGRYLQTDVYNELQYFPEDPFEKATMSDEEIEAFLSLEPEQVTRFDTRRQTTYTYFLGLRRWKLKTMFWKCLAYTGARPGEIAQLTIDDVDFGRQVFLVNGKTGHRQIPIADHLIKELQDYIKDLDTPHLFPAERGGKTRQNGCINDVAWGYDFHQRLRRLGIKRKNLTPYSLRHSFVTRMLSEDVNIFKVQKIVGHRQITTTQKYTHLTTKDMIKTLSQDPLSLKHKSFDDRLQLFRDNVRQLLAVYAKTYAEEKEMIKSFFG